MRPETLHGKFSYKPWETVRHQCISVQETWPVCCHCPDGYKNKLTFGYTLILKAPHSLRSLLKGHIRDECLTSRWPNTISCLRVNPAFSFTRFVTTRVVRPQLCQSFDRWWPCGSFIWLSQSDRPGLVYEADMNDVPLSTLEEVLFTNWNSFTQNRIRYAEAVVET